MQTFKLNSNKSFGGIPRPNPGAASAISDAAAHVERLLSQSDPDPHTSPGLGPFHPPGIDIPSINSSEEIVEEVVVRVAHGAADDAFGIDVHDGWKGLCDGQDGGFPRGLEGGNGVSRLRTADLGGAKNEQAEEGQKAEGGQVEGGRGLLADFLADGGRERHEGEGCRDWGVAKGHFLRAI